MPNQRREIGFVIKCIVFLADLGESEPKKGEMYRYIGIKRVMIIHCYNKKVVISEIKGAQIFEPTVL